MNEKKSKEIFHFLFVYFVVRVSIDVNELLYAYSKEYVKHDFYFDVFAFSYMLVIRMNSLDESL